MGTVAPPVRLGGRRPADAARPAPAIGQHTEDVLAEAGYTREDVARLRQAGVLR